MMHILVHIRRLWGHFGAVWGHFLGVEGLCGAFFGGKKGSVGAFWWQKGS